MQTLEHYIGVSTWIIFFLIVIILVSIIAAINSKKNKKWLCDTCDIQLVRSQIKFGLCPKCGKKVKGFRPLKPQGFPR